MDAITSDGMNFLMYAAYFGRGNVFKIFTKFLQENELYKHERP